MLQFKNGLRHRTSVTLVRMLLNHQQSKTPKKMKTIKARSKTKSSLKQRKQSLWRQSSLRLPLSPARRSTKRRKANWCKNWTRANKWWRIALVKGSCSPISTFGKAMRSIKRSRTKQSMKLLFRNKMISNSKCSSIWEIHRANSNSRWTLLANSLKNGKWLMRADLWLKEPLRIRSSSRPKWSSSRRKCWTTESSYPE